MNQYNEELSVHPRQTGATLDINPHLWTQTYYISVRYIHIKEKEANICIIFK